MIASYVGLEELNERLADRSIGLQAMRVLLAMMSSCDYENRVRMRQADLSRGLSMARSHVSEAIADLVSSGFVERDSGRGGYVVSPKICWKGSEDTLRAALAKRGLLDNQGFLRSAA
jgi:DNA-binding IclR family transcriptional regulator